jgi:hypothetical protein
MDHIDMMDYYSHNSQAPVEDGPFRALIGEMIRIAAICMPRIGPTENNCEVSYRQEKHEIRKTCFVPADSIDRLAADSDSPNISLVCKGSVYFLAIRDPASSGMSYHRLS